MAVTKLTNLINPEVMADMIDGKIANALVVTPFATVDRSLAGQPGDTITVPQYDYIGDAVDVAEGSDVTPVTLSATEATYTVKKAMQAVTLTDEAVLSGYGNPQGQAATQLAKSIASKVDADGITALLAGSHVYNATDVISYDSLVDAIDVFNEELNTEKVIFINPKQVTQLRHDKMFVSADTYPNNVVMKGEIGMIANCHVVPTRRVVATGAASSGTFNCPIVKIETDSRTEDEIAALTIYLKRDTNLETERHTLNRTTDLSVDKHYVAALTNDSKVVVAKFKQQSPGKGA